MFEFINVAKDKFVLKTTTQQDMYSASEEAIQMHNDANAGDDETEEEQLRKWDEVFAKNAAENDMLTHLSRIPLNEKDLSNSIKRAAVFMANSRHERDIYHHTDSTAIKLYWIYYNRFLKSFCLLVILCLMGLALFEQPATIHIPHGITQALEILFILIILARMCLYFRVYGWENFKMNGWKIVKFVLLVGTLVDVGFQIFFPSMFRVTRVLRPFFLAEHITVLRARISLIFRTISKMPEFLFLMMFNVVFHSLIAYTVFSNNPNDGYFANLFDSFINIFVLQTTANYPDVTIPAVTKWPVSSLFFVWFLLLQLYFVFNLNIATVFNNYKSELDNKKVANYIRKRVALLSAFRMLDNDNKGYIDLESWKALFKVYRPRSSDQKAQVKFELEDTDGTGRVGLCQFFRLCDDIVAKIHTAPNARRAAKRFQYTPLLNIVTHKIFKTGIMILIALNCILVVLQLALEDPRKPKKWTRGLEIVFVILFTLELVLKLIARGPIGFVKRKWNLYDTFVVVISIIGLILQVTQVPSLRPTMLIAGMRLFRMLKFIRYFSISDRLRIILDTLFEVLPAASAQIAIVLIWYYSYGIIGMDLYAGKLSRDNPALANTDYNALNFYKVANFDNILNVFLTQYHLTVVNNWHVTMRGAIAVTTKWACVYFIIFWLFTVIIFMNLVVATVLDIFSNQFVAKQKKMQKERLQKAEEEKLKVQEESVKSSPLTQRHDHDQDTQDIVVELSDIDYAMTLSETSNIASSHSQDFMLSPEE